MFKRMPQRFSKTLLPSHFVEEDISAERRAVFRLGSRERVALRAALTEELLAARGLLCGVDLVFDGGGGLLSVQGDGDAEHGDGDAQAST